MRQHWHNCLISLTFLAVTGVLSGCPGNGGGADAGPADAGPDARPTGVVELGTGTTSFEGLADNAEVILWAGPQGGHHLIVHARMRDLLPGDPVSPSAPGNPRTTFSAFDRSGRQVDLMLPPYALGYRDGGDDWWYLPSGRLLRMDEALVPQLFGNPMRVTVAVEDANGDTGTDERWIVPIAEPALDAGVP